MHSIEKDFDETGFKNEFESPVKVTGNGSKKPGHWVMNKKGVF
jgi:hypothetical protein